MPQLARACGISPYLAADQDSLRRYRAPSAFLRRPTPNRPGDDIFRRKLSHRQQRCRKVFRSCGIAASRCAISAEDAASPAMLRHLGATRGIWRELAASLSISRQRRASMRHVRRACGISRKDAASPDDTPHRGATLRHLAGPWRMAGSAAHRQAELRQLGGPCVISRGISPSPRYPRPPESATSRRGSLRMTSGRQRSLTKNEDYSS
jgi:hypothetical protein